ncbi:MAG: hypothetical protein WC565_03930 [Parcubacteria group bacterium]|jgi:hypothetical protein
MASYESRLRIPVFGVRVDLYTGKNNVLVAHSYRRVVIGDRGPYVEFRPDDLVAEVESVDTPHYYYEGQIDGVKVYRQRKRVSYADYVPGMLYLSPFELVLTDGRCVIEKKGDGQLSLF